MQGSNTVYTKINLESIPVMIQASRRYQALEHVSEYHIYSSGPFY